MTLDQDERQQLFGCVQLLLELLQRANRDGDDRAAGLAMMAVDAIKTLVEGATMVD